MRTLESWEHLQALIGKVSEAADIDFKGQLSPRQPGLDAELAKDIAALANTTGGHLVIGARAVVGKTQCSGFDGVDEPTATALVPLLERAARDRCRPTPFVSTQLIGVPNASNRVLVLRVQMSPVAPVGACEDPQSGGRSTSRLWTFPYRVGSETAFLSPDQFGAYESMSARRAAALLNSIPEGERGRLSLRWEIARERPSSNMRMRAGLMNVRLERNSVEFSLVPDAFSTDRPVVTVPLDDVATVWCHDEDWHVVLRGSIAKESMGSGPLLYFPAT